MADVIHELIATEAAIDKLGRRGIAAEEAERLPRNRHAIQPNVRGPEGPRHQPVERRVVIGRTDGGRSLTLVVEQTIDPESWLIITGWESTDAERKIIE
jgi:hypothetical protein